jgi:hypothetical protein
MGYHKDLGSAKVMGIDPVTGYPIDRWNHLLDPLSSYDGRPVVGWNTPGTVLSNLTSPYGFLEFMVGGDGDFACFDSRVIDCGPLGRYTILHGVINTDSSNYIGDGAYFVMPSRSIEECAKVVWKAVSMVDEAVKQFDHSRRGTNQHPYYFVRAVARSLFPWKFDGRITERQLRFGGARINRIVDDILTKGVD